MTCKTILIIKNDEQYIRTAGNGRIIFSAGCATACGEEHEEGDARNDPNEPVLDSATVHDRSIPSNGRALPGNGYKPARFTGRDCHDRIVKLNSRARLCFQPRLGKSFSSVPFVSASLCFTLSA